MDDLKVIRTFTKDNTNENEIVPVEIYTHIDIDETIKMLNSMPFYKAEKYMRSLNSKSLRKDNWYINSRSIGAAVLLVDIL